jgi:hypothetical protein
MAVEAHRYSRRSSSHVCTDTRCGDRRESLGLDHPRIDANYRPVN